MAIYFAKDFLLIVVYLSFFIAYRRRDKSVQTFRPPFLRILLVFVWFGVMQVFNPASTHIVYGLLGMKLYFYYVPLIIVGYALITSESALRKFFNINLGLMVVIIALGIVQSIVGPKFLSPEVLPDDIRLLSQTYRTAPISGVMVYRPTSIFVSIGRFQDLVIVAWLLVFGFSGYLLLRHRRSYTPLLPVPLLTSAGGGLGASSPIFHRSFLRWFVVAASFLLVAAACRRP